MGNEADSMNEEAMKQKAEAFVWALGRGDTKAMVQAL